MDPSVLHACLLDRLLELAWRQWTAIGLAGTRASRSVLVDPEALALATFEVARSDARLFDEALDWLTSNSSLIDVARLRRLARVGTSHQRRLLGVAARLAGLHGAGPTLRRLPDEDFIARESSADYGEQTLFTSSEGQPLLLPGQPNDPLFREAGYLRVPVELRALSRTPDVALPACLRFRARALVGIGARAEVLTYLWTHEWAHGREIAARSAYGQAPVAEYLSVLAQGGLAERRVEGRRILYRLCEALRGAAEEPPLYVDWVTVWPALVALLESLRPADISAEARWLRIYQALDKNEPALRAQGFEVETGEARSWVRSGPAVLQRAIAEVTDRIGDLGA